MMRKHLIVTSVAVALLAVLLLLLSALLTTQWGLRWAFAQLQGVIPGELSVGRLDGRLLGTVHIGDLRYRDGQMGVDIASLELRWRPIDLIAATLHVSRVHVSGVDLYLPPPAPPRQQPPAGPAALPEVSLPLRVEIADARIGDARIYRDAQTPLVIQQAVLSGALTRKWLRLKELHVETPDFAFSAQGRIRPQPDYTADLDVSWSVNPPDLAAVQGQGTVKGSLRELTLDQSVKGPGELAITATLYDLATSPYWRADVEVSSLNPSRLNARWPDTPITGTLNGRGDLETIETDATLQTRVARFGRIETRLSAHGSMERIDVNQLVVSLLDQPGQVSAHGRAEFAAGFNLSGITAAGTWQNVLWPLQAPPAIYSHTGHFQMEGLPEDYRFRIEAALAGPQVPEGQWTLAGTGDLEAVDLRTIEARVLEGTVRGEGMLAWSPSFRWTLDATANGLNPGSFWDQWPANLNVRANSSGNFATRLQTRVEITDVSGTLRGYPLNGHAELQIDGDHYVLPELVVRTGKARLNASGALTETWDLNWTANAEDLGAVWPDAAGILNAKGSISGPRRAPRISSSIKGENLALAKAGATSLDASLNLDTGDRQPSSITLEAQELKYGGYRLVYALVKGNGSLTDHKINARLDGDHEILVLNADGNYRNAQWQGMLRNAELNTDDFGNWALNKPMDMAFGASRAVLAPACWHSEQSIICTRASWVRDEQTDLSLSANNLPLGFFGFLAPPQVSMQGQLDANLAATLVGAKIRHARAVVNLAPSRVALPLHGEEKTSIEIQQGEFELTGGASGLDSRLVLILADTGEVSASVRLPGYDQLSAPPDTQPLNAEMNMQFGDLTFLPTFVSTLEDTRGTFDLAVGVDGTIGEPKVTGQAVLSDGGALLIDQRVRLRDVNVTVESHGSSRLSWRGSAKSGKGAIALDGETHLEGDNWPTRLHVEGERFEVMGRPDLRVLATPNIDLQVIGRKVSVEGEVKIPMARVEPQEARDRTELVRPSEDVVIVSAEKPQAQRPTVWQTGLNLRVTLGEDVRIKGYGLTAEITGKLLLNKAPEKLLTATGNLTITSGEYRAYGQELTIQQGSVIFAGSPIQNPAIELRAVRIVNGITAGIQAKGRLQEPVLTLFSEPTMEETYILSYLLLGRAPTEETSASEKELLIQAASALGLSGGYVIAKRLAQTFGIEETRLEENTLVLGRSLGSDLYISYGIGITDPSSTLEIRYQLSEHWVLETETGRQSEADLLYTIER